MSFCVFTVGRCHSAIDHLYKLVHLEPFPIPLDLFKLVTRDSPPTNGSVGQRAVRLRLKGLPVVVVFAISLTRFIYETSAVKTPYGN